MAICQHTHSAETATATRSTCEKRRYSSSLAVCRRELSCCSVRASPEKSHQ